MHRHKAGTARRIRWRVARCAEGWRPIVLIGEEPVPLPIQQDKRAARMAAKAKANSMKEAWI